MTWVIVIETLKKLYMYKDVISDLESERTVMTMDSILTDFLIECFEARAQLAKYSYMEQVAIYAYVL